MPTLTPVCNGSFEAGRRKPCWQDGGDLVRSVDQLGAGELAYAGRYSVLLSDLDLGEGLLTQPSIAVGRAWVEQAIQAPNTPTPHLSSWHRITTYDVTQDTLRQFWNTFALGSTVSGSSGRGTQRHDLGWRRGEVDLSPWRGQTVTVRFANWNGYSRGPGAELYNTWTYLDEVQVQP